MSETIFQDISLNSLLLNDASVNDYLVGEIIMWPNNTNIPYNFLPCDGRQLNKTDYSELFNIIGIKYGESGNNFLLPNLNNNGVSDSNSLLIKGITNMSGSSSVSSFSSYISSNYGNNLIQLNQIQSHKHNINILNNKSSINYNISLGNINSFGDGNQEINCANETDLRWYCRCRRKSQFSTKRNHTHNISYNTTNQSKNNNSNVVYQDSVEHSYSISLENNITNQLNYTPIHTKVNYLICYTK